MITHCNEITSSEEFPVNRTDAITWTCGRYVFCGITGYVPAASYKFIVLLAIFCALLSAGLKIPLLFDTTKPIRRPELYSFALPALAGRIDTTSIYSTFCTQAFKSSGKQPISCLWCLLAPLEPRATPGCFPRYCHPAACTFFLFAIKQRQSRLRNRSSRH